MKNILIIANSIVGKEPGVTGGESRFIELAKCWRKSGYEIHLMSGKGGKVLCEKMSLPVVLHNISNSKAIGRVEIILRFFKMFLNIPSLLFTFKEGIVYSASEQIYDVLPGFILKLFHPHKIRFGVVVHWLPPVYFWKRKQSSPLNSLMFLISERLGLLLANINADALLPVSEETLNELVKSKLNKRPTKFVLCGVNLEEIDSYASQTAAKNYDAVFMKRLQKTKGIFDLIEMWEMMVVEKKDAKLLIIGEGIDGNEARKMVSEKNLEKNIEFAGVVYDPKIKFEMLASAKIFILPSYEENWAIVIGEAMRVGLPVVCYALKELRAVWEDNIIYSKLGDKKDLLEKVKELLASEQKRLEIAQKARRYVEKYSWQRIAEEELAFILGKGKN
ncbi:MAG: glycosyl transferase [Patescibacteria group bacterium]|nr:MAG: glycosyl transferase [Patescibacteria group bacterium]